MKKRDVSCVRIPFRVVCGLLIVLLLTNFGSNVARGEWVFGDSAEFSLDLPADLFIGSFADSGDFALDLLAELYIGSTADSDIFAINLPAGLYIGSTADSEVFSMNLYPVYRTSSDSRYFRVWNWYGDLNDSGRVDMEDLVILSQHWTEACDPPEFCDESDTGPDGTIDMEDLLDLASVWLQSPPG